MKNLKELTKEQLNKLKDCGMLKVLYPEAPDEFISKPEPLDNPDFTTLAEYCQDYLNSKVNPENPETRFKDGEQHIFEEAMKCVFGEDIFVFLNSLD